MAKDKAMCRGCHDNFYNVNREGGCWCFENATIVERIQVGVWEPPPYKRDRAQKVLSCYRPEGYSMLKTDDCRVVDSYGERP
jgi:hypothetical protein